MMSLLDNKVSGSSLSKYAFTYDGNGNITELTDNAGSTVATYRYTAFGDVWSSSGSAASENQYRFSTKPLDEEVLRSSSGAFNAGLYYYGFRYYDPQTGRWPSRDPIGELGGLNLYGMVGNDAVNEIDLLGLQGRSTRCRPKSGFDLSFQDFQNVSVALDDSNATPDPYMTGVLGDLFDVFFRIRGNAKVKVSCHRTKRDSDGCCKTTKASATVGPFNFDITQSHRVSLFNPVTGLRALNIARWAARIANGVQNILEVKAALEAKAKADEVCRRILE
jgi:RHS repeat-associated protein